jgi:carbamoyltransferase
MNVLGFSGIRNGERYQERYGLRFVGHDAAVALVCDGKVAFAAEEERFSRRKHTSSFPVGALQAAFDHTGMNVRDLDLVAYPWVVTPLKFLRMNLNHSHRIPLLHGPELALAGLNVMRDLMSPRRIAKQFAKELGHPLPSCRGVSHHLCHSACAKLHVAVRSRGGSNGRWARRGREWVARRMARHTVLPFSFHPFA